MNRNLAIAALLLTAGCRQDRPAPPPANAVAATPAAADKPAVPSLKGNWQVGDAAGLTARFAGGTVVLTEGCVRRAWTYKQKGNSVAFATAPGGSSNCGGASSGALDAAFGPLSDANIAVFSADGKQVTLSGLGGPLQLERR